MRLQTYIIILWLNLQFCCTLDNNSKSLEMLQIVFRHGERTPTETYKNDPHKFWPEGWGQLTKKGKQELYQLGSLFRQSYAHFLSEYYWPSNVSIMSSYADRNLMSAQLLLAGLYPPVKEQVWNPDLLWQPVPVKYLPRDLDNLIAQKRKCPVYDSALVDAYNSERIKQINEKHKDLYDYLSKNTGEKIDGISPVEFLYNTLEIEQLHNLSLPDWLKNVSMSTLRTLAAENLAIFTDTQLMKRLKGGPLLKDIMGRMVEKTQHLNPDLNIALYSAHDVTIVNLLRTLGYQELLKPDYAASVIFELHNIGTENYVKIFYKSNVTSHVEEITTKFCATPCILNDFLNKLQPVLTDNWEKECGLF